MTDIAIRCEDLGKRYRVGQQRGHGLLSDVLTRAVARPFGRNDTTTRRGDDVIWALRHVSFDVRHGDAVAIIGRNGAGKSTLLRVLSRITKPTEGFAEIRGRLSSLLEVGTGFHPELTGRENVFLNGAILGMRRADIVRRFDEIVAFAEVERFIDVPVKHYSSGMHVRLAFAVAAHLEPEILLVDEVLAVGDLAFQRKCLGKMEDVARCGRTVLFVSHNMAAVKTLCGRGMLIEAGANRLTGPVDQVLEAYVNSLVPAGAGGLQTHGGRRRGTAELTIQSVMMTDDEARPTSHVRVGERLSVTVAFSVDEPVRGARIGLGFNTTTGVRIATAHHTDGALDPFSGSPGHYELSFDFRNPLLPGTYVVSAGAHRLLGGQTLDYVPDAARFDVLPLATADASWDPHNAGLVAFSGTWGKPLRVA